MGDIFVVVN